MVNKFLENNVKPLILKKNEKKYIKGMEVIFDQYVQDALSKDYKTDSLYTLEFEGCTVKYYELLLENYVLPPNTTDDIPADINKRAPEEKKSETEKQDMFSFNVFNIKAKCNFEKCSSSELLSKLNPKNKIITLKSEKELQVRTSDIIKLYRDFGYIPLYVSCNENLNYQPWGFFDKLFKQYYELSVTNGLISSDFDCKRFNNIKNLILGNPGKSSTPEDARFAQMEMFVNFLTALKQCVIIIDGFENLDDTSIQTLDLFFDNFKKINPNFIFITDENTTVHSKIKGLLRTPLYTEITLTKNSITTLLSELKEDAADFIESFYYEKIKENFNGSKLYFENSLRYLTDKGVLAKFEGKLIIRNSNSVILPKTFEQLIKIRLKSMSKKQDASMILASSIFLGERIDFATLEVLGIKDIPGNVKFLEDGGFAYVNNSSVYINNYSLVSSIFLSSLKKEVQEMIAKNITGKLGKLVNNTTLIKLMETMSIFKEEYLLLWKNSQYAILTGDYDAYLKNCLGFLSITDKIKGNINQEDIEHSKKEVFQNILLTLYNYSPAKIYSIENILLMDAINENDDEKIVNENCIDIGEKLLGVLKPDNLQIIKPDNFSVNLFVNHLLDTFRLVALAKVITMDDSINEFFESVKRAFNEDLPEKNCIIAIKDFLAGVDYIPSNTEEETPFSKVVFLILKELSAKPNDYKSFAINIYQAKLLAADIHQTRLEYICDLLIAYAYAKSGINSKASYIFNDILDKSEKSAIFSVMVIANYMMSLMQKDNNEINDALMTISNMLNTIQKHDNQSKVFFAMFEKLYIDTMSENNRQFNTASEWQKLINTAPNGELARIFNGNAAKEFSLSETQGEFEEEEFDDLAKFVPDEESDDEFKTETHGED